MNVLWFLLVGVIAGWLAGVLVKGGGFGLIGDLVVGIIGALIGGLLFSGLAGAAGGGLLGSILGGHAWRGDPAGGVARSETGLMANRGLLFKQRRGFLSSHFFPLPGWS